MRERVESVLHVVYLLFNEGYGATGGDSLVRRSLCEDSLYLARLLVDNPDTDRPEVHALLALMEFQSSRLTARSDSEGNVLLLEDQDRSLWDRGAIQRGMTHLQAARRGCVITRFHLEAGIASVHAAAESFDSTDWSGALTLYDSLLEMTGSPVVALNRAVALAMVEGPEAGLAVIESLQSHLALRGYYLLPATLGWLHERAHAAEDARRCYRSALECRCTEPERRFLQRRIGANHPCADEDEIA